MSANPIRVFASIPEDDLQALADAFESGRPPSPKEMSAFLSAWRQWRRGSPWSQCLAQNGAAAMRLRDERLREVAALIAPGAGLWDQAGELLAAVERFENQSWGALIRGLRKPRGKVESLLWDARRANRCKPLPVTRQGYLIVLRNGR